MNTWLYFSRRIALLLALASALGGCDRMAESAPQSKPAFTVLAGSELKELEPALKDAAAQAGLGLQISYAGTLDMVERINAGESFDAILPPNGAYPALALSVKPLAREKLFYSRVALGVKPEALARLRWNAAQPPSWADIARAAGRGQLRYGMSNPMKSNTGMSALLGVAYAAAGKSEDLRLQDQHVRLRKDFLAGHQLKANSSGWLADAFARDPSAVDALISYESVILRLNPRLPEAHRLALLYPKDGVISADYPLMLLSANRRDDFNKLVSAIKSPAFQTNPVQAAYLRPALPEAALNPALPTVAVAELAFPNNLDVVGALINALPSNALPQWQKAALPVPTSAAGAFAGDPRRPGTFVFAYDNDVAVPKELAAALAEQIVRIFRIQQIIRPPERWAKMTPAPLKDKDRILWVKGVVVRSREIMVSNPDEIYNSVQEILAEQRYQVLKKIQDQASYLIVDGDKEIKFVTGRDWAHGSESIYTALISATEEGVNDVRKTKSEGPLKIIFFTDGKIRGTNKWNSFKEEVDKISPQRVRLFPLLVSGHNTPELMALAQFTGGQVFDVRLGPPGEIFKWIKAQP